MSDYSHLRIGTDDRTQAVARLQRAAAEGRLTAVEADSRMAALDAALTYADLDALLGDLPPIAPPAVAPGWDAGHPRPIAGGMSREKRAGAWEIPPYLKVSGDFGSVRLDCRQAVCLAPVIDIEVSAGAGSVKIIVPPGWGVDSDQVTKGWGSVRNTASRRAEPGQPQLVLHGSAGVGRLRVRTAPRQHRHRHRPLRELSGAPTPALGWTEQHSDMPNADDLR
jgi:Domain of unknown function (DUF1707)